MNSLATNSVRQLLKASQSAIWSHGVYRYRHRSVALSFFKVSTEDVDNTLAPLLIFHGLFGMKINWRTIANQLAAKTKRPIYSLDLRNHGDSPHVKGEESTIADMASDIGYFMERTYMEQASILGHSLGGRVACQFAFHSPEKVEKLILADVSPVNRLPPIDFLSEDLFDYMKLILEDLPSDLDISKARREVGGKLMPRIMHQFIVDFFLLSLYKDTDGVFKWKFNCDALKTFVAKREVDKVDSSLKYTGPSLIIYGGKSNYVRAEDFPDIRTCLPAVTFAPIPEAGHYLHVQKPAEFVNYVVKFLND